MKITTKMKSVALACFLIAVPLAWFPPRSQTSKEMEKNRERQNVADWVVNHIQYIKDPRTGFCYAFYESGSGRSMTLVPEKDIPTDLITTAKIENK